MKVKIVVRPTGLINGSEWPEVGETIDLPDAVAEGMIEAGHVEKATAKKAAAKEPAAKKAAEKPDKSEKRPAAKADTETRKG